jgi:hypothetical protein
VFRETTNFNSSNFDLVQRTGTPSTKTFQCVGSRDLPPSLSHCPMVEAALLRGRAEPSLCAWRRLDALPGLMEVGVDTRCVSTRTVQLWAGCDASGRHGSSSDLVSRHPPSVQVVQRLRPLATARVGLFCPGRTELLAEPSSANAARSEP